MLGLTMYYEYLSPLTCLFKPQGQEIRCAMSPARPPHTIEILNHSITPCAMEIATPKVSLSPFQPGAGLIPHRQTDHFMSFQATTAHATSQHIYLNTPKKLPLTTQASIGELPGPRELSERPSQCCAHELPTHATSNSQRTWTVVRMGYGVGAGV